MLGLPRPRTRTADAVLANGTAARRASPRRAPARRQRLSAFAAAAVLSVALSGLTVVPAVAAADNPADIPGIPLPGSIVSGILGGAVYDVVYRVDLAPGSIIVASLSGSPGTDFDLYLFDDSATTVVTNVGVVARSTGPTSTESLSWATATGGRFYIDLNGATETQGAYTLTVQTAVDRTPPVLAITLEGGRPSINRSTVTVALAASDDLAPVSEMSFSADGIAYGPWQAYAPTGAVALAPGDGLRTAWARVRNAVGLESTPASATIVVDTRAPLVIGVSPAPGAHVASLRPLIRLDFDEPIAPASWAADGLLVHRADGARVSGRTAVGATGQSATFTPDEDLPAGTAILLTLGPVTDLAGNEVASTPSWTILPLAAASIAARVGASPVAQGAAVTITGTYRGSTPAPRLTLAARVGADASFGPPVDLPVAADGTFLAVVRPAASTTYRLAAPETWTVGGALADVSVAVRRDLRLLAGGTTAGVGGAAVGTTRAGRKVVVAATAGPAALGLTVTFRLYRWSTAARSWALISTRTARTTAAGSAATGWTPTSPGRYRWRAAVASTADYSSAWSGWVTWTVTR